MCNILHLLVTSLVAAVAPIIDKIKLRQSSEIALGKLDFRQTTDFSEKGLKT